MEKKMQIKGVMIEADVTNLIDLIHGKISEAMRIKDFVTEKLDVLKQHSDGLANFLRNVGTPKMEIINFTSSGTTDKQFTDGQTLIARCKFNLINQPTDDPKQVQAKLKYMWDEYIGSHDVTANFDIGSIEGETVNFNIFIS